MTDYTVRQEDRDAAADLIERYWSGADEGMMKLARSYREGHSQGVFVRAFARHREQTTAEIVAWLRSDLRTQQAKDCRYAPEWQQTRWAAADAIERGDHHARL